MGGAGLGLALASLAPEARESTPERVLHIPTARDLSNRLLECVESLLPAERWGELGRLAVATGPGGFTSTRLTVVFARTLAQQLELPLDGPSSFLLIARRLWQAGEAPPQPFWLVQELPRRGTVAGAYGPRAEALGGLAELEQPWLFREPQPWLPPQAAEPHRPALVEPEADAAQLLALGQLAAAADLPGPWGPVLPLYPTSPVEGL